jgi:ABC-type dipeptide/oligopeptide/nickel transport system permease subunit
VSARPFVATRTLALKPLGSRVLRSWTGRIGVALVLALVVLTVFGPLFAKYSPSQIVGIPYQSPSSRFPLGTDSLGRDVLTRLLYGGRTVIGLAGAATLLAYLAGVTIGLTAGYRRGAADTVLMRAMDVIIAFPPILLLLVLATGAGAKAWVLILGVAITHVPGIARVVRAATLEVAVRGYVEAAAARGERSSFVLGREILPNIGSTILADVGIRLSGSILLVASVNYLGLGLRPPTADWALMISENREALITQPWAVVAPAVAIALLAIGVNLVADAVARGLGTSIARRGVAR